MIPQDDGKSMVIRRTGSKRGFQQRRTRAHGKQSMWKNQDTKRTLAGLDGVMDTGIQSPHPRQSDKIGSLTSLSSVRPRACRWKG